MALNKGFTVGYSVILINDGSIHRFPKPGDPTTRRLQSLCSEGFLEDGNILLPGHGGEKALKCPKFKKMEGGADTGAPHQHSPTPPSKDTFAAQ